MHILEIEFLVNDINIDRRLDVFIDARVKVLPDNHNNNNNETTITQEDIKESVRTIPTPKRTHSQDVALVLLINIEAINGVRCTRPLIYLTITQENINELVCIIPTPKQMMHSSILQYCSMLRVCNLHVLHIVVYKPEPILLN